MIRNILFPGVFRHRRAYSTPTTTTTVTTGSRSSSSSSSTSSRVLTTSGGCASSRPDSSRKGSSSWLPIRQLFSPTCLNATTNSTNSSLYSSIIRGGAPKSVSSSSFFSTRASTVSAEDSVGAVPTVDATTSSNSSSHDNNNNNSRPPGYTRPQVFQTADGREIAIFRPAPAGNRKLKPHLVARRLRAMRTYIGQERNIRHSPWRLNLLCQFAAGLPLQQALLQLQFSKKSKARLVHDVLKRTSNLAEIRHGLVISELEVAECFATRATPLKRINIMGRGRHGKLEHRHCHLRVVLREIDFPLRIFKAHSMNQKKAWFQRQQEAAREGARARAEREQLKRLEREAAEKANANTAAAK